MNIFTLCTLIGFLVKYSMAFLREKIFFLLLGDYLYLFWLWVVAQLQNSRVFLFSVMYRHKGLKVRSLALEHR